MARARAALIPRLLAENGRGGELEAGGLGLGSIRERRSDSLDKMRLPCLSLGTVLIYDGDSVRPSHPSK